MKPKYKEYFLGGLLGRTQQFVQDNQGAIDQGLDVAGNIMNPLKGKGRGLRNLSGFGLARMLGERLRGEQPAQQQSAPAQRVRKYKGPEFNPSANTGVPMFYGEDSAAVTLPDSSAEKEKRFVQSNYGTGENRITEADIKRNRSLDPYEEYGPFVIKGDHYGKTRQSIGYHPKKMGNPGYFLIQGYTDEQQQKNVEAGRPDATQQYILEVSPGGSKRVVPLDQVMNEFTTGVEGETTFDILQAMDTNPTRTKGGFMLPSREDQIQTLLKRRENYGLGDIKFDELVNELGLNVPELQKGEFAEALKRALQDRAQGTRN